MIKAVKTVLTVAVFLLASGFSLEPKERLYPQKYQPQIASLVSTYLTYYHYARYDLNDTISQRLLDKYISSLDPNKMFFLQSDINQFQQYRYRLDDDLRANPVQLEAPFAIFNLYKQRVHERVDVILKQLEQEFDFSKSEFYFFDREDLPYAESAEELNELWRLRLKEEMVRFKLREREEDSYLELLNRRYARLKKTLDEYEPVDVLERYLSALSESFDPHSSYLKPATKDNFDIQMGHSVEGIGATLTRDGEYTVVVEVVKGGPAGRSGQIQPNDKIIAVAQGDEPAEDVVDLRLDKVVKKIRGKKGTKVRLTVIPADAADQSETKEVALIRDKVEITAADARADIHETSGPDGQVFRVGVIEIPSFYMDSEAKFKGDPNYKSTTRDVRRLLDELEKKEVDALVIDLRQNGGGSLDEAIQLTGLFIEEGPVVQIKDYRDKVRVEDDPDAKLVYDGPLVVLTSVFSASASEIFSSAIQDYERGIVVGGSSTHGKGTVQNIIGLQSSLSRMTRENFKDDVAGALKLTTNKFYRISGGATQFKGVTPDIVLPSPFDGMDVTEDALEYALPWDEIQPAKYKSYGMVQDSLAFLKTNSAKRVEANLEFRWLREDREQRELRQKKNRVSLKLAKRIEEKEELEAMQKTRSEQRKTMESPIKVEPLFEEEEAATAQAEKADAAEVDDEAADSEAAEIEALTPVPDFILAETVMIARDYVYVQKARLAALADGKKDSL